MSITGSLVGYENNNDVAGKKKRRSLLQQHNNSMGKNCTASSLNSSISNSIVTNASSLSQQHHQKQLQHKYMNSKRKYAKYSNMHPSHMADHNNYLHLNSLWSIWYGVLLTLFQGYLAVHGAYRFIGCSLIPWKIEPVAELNLQIVLSGVVFILLPLFFTSAVFKVGNLANDGIKLATGAKQRHCSITPHDGLDEEAHGGTLKALWTHGGPTAAFLHIVIAMCLLLPRLLLEARIIENGLLPRENIWQTELDFIAVNRRNLVVLSVVTSPYQNISSSVEDEEDFYNDTMFTAIGVGSFNNNNNIDNNLYIDTNTNTKLKEKQNGSTRLFEVNDTNNEDDVLNRGNAADDNVEEFVTTADKGAASVGRKTGIINGGVSVEELDSNEFMATKSLKPQTTTTTATTTSTTSSTTRVMKTSSTSTEAKLESASESETTTAGTGKRVLHRNYDKTWDKLGTIGKGNGNRLNEGDDLTTTVITTTWSSGNTSLAAGSDAQTTTAREFTTVLAKTTAQATALSSSTSSTSTPAPTTTMPPPVTQPTKTHAHSSHSSHSTAHHAHNHNHHHSHTGKATRKHGHRQHRQRTQSHRRHHSTTTTTASSIAEEQQLLQRLADNEFAETMKRPKVPDFNRLDEDLELPASVYEQPTGKYASGRLNEDFDDGRRTPYPKSTSTISTTTRDSNIHIVKPEMLPEIIPSTPVSSNSKIIEIKTQTKKVKRMADDEMQVEIEPEYLIGDLGDERASNTNDSALANASNYDSSEDMGKVIKSDTSVLTPTATTTNNVNEQTVAPARLDGFAGMLQIFFGIEKPIDVAVFSHPPSAEFINLLVALLVWCVRYPAVFWTTTKSFATIFSVQMIAAALDIIFSYIGASSLYKLQVYSEAMPVQHTGLILNGVVTMSLFLLSTVLVLASSMIMYLYGHGRLAAKMRDRSLITMKSSETWIYFAHCASLCYVLALAVVKAPLLNDLSATYRSNLHCPTFLSALISVVHLLLWIVIWLGLTVKRRWTFKLPPMDAYGIAKATTQPLLMSNRSSLPGVGGSNSGGSSTVGISEHKGIISNTSSTDGGTGSNGSGSAGNGVEDIYWPKLTPSSPKLKVTFNEVTSTSDDDVLLIGDHEQNDGKRNSPRGTAVCFTSAAGEIDEGEYATLRATTTTVLGGGGLTAGCGGIGTGAHGGSNINIIGSVQILHLSEYDELPPPPPQLMTATARPTGTSSSIAVVTSVVGDYANCIIADADNISEEGKLLACVRDDSVTYASTRVLEPPQAAATPALATTAQQSTLLTDDTPNIHAANKNPAGRAPHAMPETMQLSSSSPEHHPRQQQHQQAHQHQQHTLQRQQHPHQHLVSPLAPVTVTVHTNEAHISCSSTPRCLRRGDSGVPNEALTPRSDTTSTTESTISPPERAPSESSSGVHSGEERDVEVVIRPRVACKPPAKPPQPAIQEEPYGRCTNMRMSSFMGDPMRSSVISSNGNNNATNSATLPSTRTVNEPKYDYTQHCSTMPLPIGCHSQQQQQHYSTSSASSMTQSQNVSSFKNQYANSAVAMAGANAAKLQQLQQQHHHQQQQQQQQQQNMHTTLPNGVRYSNPHFLRRLPHVTKAAESPYGHLGLGAGHHTFSKLLHDPLQGSSLVNSIIPEDRDSANYSMSSDQDCNLYATANHLN